MGLLPNEPTCESCRFWNPPAVAAGETVIVGECRRYPPTVLVMVWRLTHNHEGDTLAVPGDHEGVDYRAWPITQHRDRCGEWKGPARPESHRTDDITWTGPSAAPTGGEHG